MKEDITIAYTVYMLGFMVSLVIAGIIKLILLLIRRTSNARLYSKDVNNK